MTTYNTGNPIGSTDARDRSDNSENLDLAVNSLAMTFEDRLGVTRDTLEGIYQKSAYYRAGTFDAGYTLTNNRQTLAYGNIEYSWSGTFPKVVAAGSTPETSGGIGAGAWVDKTDVTLRADLSSPDAAGLIGGMTYSSLRLYSGGKTTVYVVGKVNVFDGGHGLFDLDINDLTSVDNGITILVDALGRKWHRRFSGEINLLWAAAGDGVTNDYNALVAAHSALPVNGGVIYAPGGHEYLIDGNFVSTKAYVKIRGDGDAIVSGDNGCTAFIKTSTVSGPAITLRGAGSALEMFSINGQAGNVGDGIQVLAQRCGIKRVSSCGMGKDGIRIGSDDSGYNCNLWVLEDVKAKSNGRHGIALDDKPVASPGLADCNGGNLRHCDIQYNTADGLYIGNSQLNTFIGVVSQSNSSRGVTFSSLAKYNTYVGGDSELSGGDEIYLAAGSTGNVVIGGVVTGSVSDFGTSNTLLGIGGNAAYSGIKLKNISSSVKTVLDWYEEVDWSSSAELTFLNPGNKSVSYNTKICTAQRIGNEVVARFTIVTSSFTHTTASGALLLAGLPWPSVSGQYSAGALQYQGITNSSKTCITSRMPPLSSSVRFGGSGSGVSIGEISATDTPTGGSIVLVGEIRYQCSID